MTLRASCPASHCRVAEWCLKRASNQPTWAFEQGQVVEAQILLGVATELGLRGWREHKVARFPAVVRGSARSVDRGNRVSK